MRSQQWGPDHIKLVFLETPASLLSPSTKPKERPCEDATRRWPPTSKEESHHQKQNWMEPCSWPSSLQKLQENTCLSHPVYGILLQQLEQTNTACFMEAKLSGLGR